MQARDPQREALAKVKKIAKGKNYKLSPWGLSIAC